MSHCKSLTNRNAVFQDVLDSTTDIRDLEFALANNIDDLRNRSGEAVSSSTASLIKLIICSGLYPQFAFPDEHNPYRKSNELVYHTQCKNKRELHMYIAIQQLISSTAKRFLSLHPSSVLTAHPDWIQGTGKNVRRGEQRRTEVVRDMVCVFIDGIK